MLDVHPPHHAANTWRDFLIHIATIVVGLLIAVGLEQAVEAIHHHQVRENLRRALAEEVRSNAEFTKANFTWVALDKDWALRQARLIEASGPTSKLVIEFAPAGRIYIPDTGAWLCAKANGDVNLLSKIEQEWQTDFNRVESDIFVSDQGAVGRVTQALVRLDKDLLNMKAVADVGLDLTPMNAQQRAETADAFRSVAANDHAFQTRMITYSSYVDLLNSYVGADFEHGDGDEHFKQFLEIERKIGAAHPDSLPTYANPKGY